MDGLEEWIALHKGQGAGLKSLAKRAIKKIKKDSELKELWEESEDYKGWLNTITDLESRI